MQGRGLTNLLLAVIAGVLLFGKDAMVGGIQGAFIVGAAIAVIFGALMVAAYFISEISKAYREAKDWQEVTFITFGFVMMALLVPIGCYVGYLWLQGVERPLAVVFDSWLGTAWMAFCVLGACVWACVGATRGGQWIIENRGALPAYGRLGIRYMGIATIAPFLLPVSAWRLRKQSGSGLFMRSAAAAYGLVEGLAVWFGILMAGILAAIGLGLIE